MVKVTIIGWYGTETIGDRAILAGIFSVLKECYGEFEVELGAIYPFFTERTILEDRDFLGKCAGNENVKISIFDSQNIKELNTSIKGCDILAMGGGPLMGMWALYMVEYAFTKAKKLGKKTLTIGCGVGPMIKERYEKSLINIIKKSDITIFRDQVSAKEYLRLSGEGKKVYAAIDPAVIAALKFKEFNPSVEKDDNTIVACVRDFPMEYRINDDIKGEEINKKVKDFLISLQFKTGKTIKLLPMHYFAIGGDDRVFMNNLKFETGNENIIVKNDPLSLEETFRVFSSAYQCVGMRFHSVVLQTILNGNNYVLDYTDPEKGKIGGFLKRIGAFDHYKKRYVNLQICENTNNLTEPVKFEVDESKINELTKIFYSKIK